MSNSLLLEMRFGSRSLLRDNWLCERMVRDLRRHETMTEEQIAELQAAALHRTLVAAIAKLPYYRRIPSRFPVARAVEVLHQYFPVIDRQTLLQNRSRLYPHAGISMMWNSVGKISGASEASLSVFRNPMSVVMENAFMRRHREWGGVQPGTRCASLRGDVIVPVDRIHPPYWFHNRYNNQLLVSSAHLKEPCMDAIADELEQFAPQMLQAFPSTAFRLAQFLEQKKRHLRIPVVFTASEPLHAQQRNLIEERFGARVMDMFGMAERVMLATECEFGSMHVNPDYSYVELIDDNGQPTRDVGYVVGTTFHSQSMPLVRYRLADRTRWISGQCRCARPFPMVEPVIGKQEDGIFGSTGTFVRPSALTFAFDGRERVDQGGAEKCRPAQWHDEPGARNLFPH
jgi:phenylacetate-CoA ligase